AQKGIGTAVTHEIRDKVGVGDNWAKAAMISLQDAAGEHGARVVLAAARSGQCAGLAAPVGEAAAWADAACSAGLAAAGLVESGVRSEGTTSSLCSIM